jgi:hypothetical protein
MELHEWIAEFAGLHQRAREGGLSAALQRRYLEDRESLAQTLLAAQRLTLKPGEKPRRAVRVARFLPVELHFSEAPQRATTLDISKGGFAVLLGEPPKIGDELAVVLKPPGGAQPINGRSTVVGLQKVFGNHRVAFVFQGISAENIERLERLVFDAVLEQLRGV